MHSFLNIQDIRDGAQSAEPTGYWLLATGYCSFRPLDSRANLFAD